MLKGRPLVNFKNIAIKCTSPSHFKLANDEKNLIAHGASELVAIENASELIKQCVLHHGSFLETVLTFIAKSATVPVYVVGQIDFHWPENGNTPVVTSHKVPVKVPPGYEYAIGLLSQDLGKDGGHYASVVYNVGTNQVDVYDSMQTYNKSNHTFAFKKAAKMLFGATRVTSYNCKCNNRTCHQPTGGFLTNQSNLVAQQDPESQHHFCYMEALLHLAEQFAGYKNAPDYYRPKINEELTNNSIRLFAIKRWIYALVHKFPSKRFTGGVKQYIDANFTNVWLSKSLFYNARSRKWQLKPNAAPFHAVEIPFIREADQLKYNDLTTILQYVHQPELLRLPQQNRMMPTNVKPTKRVRNNNVNIANAPIKRLRLKPYNRNNIRNLFNKMAAR